MLNKWFKGKSVPTNSGNSLPSKIEKLHYSKIFELELSNMEETPVYALTHQLTIGSEIGNIIISDPSVSPRHATFILQDEVPSVIDHGSVSGTFINGKKIPAGKYIILEEADVVLVGDLELRMKVSRSSVKAEEIPEIPGTENEVSVAPPEIPQEVKKTSTKVPKKKEEKKEVSAVSDKSANALVRVVAVITDLLLSYALLVIFMPFEDFRNLLDFIPDLLNSSVGVEWAAIWEEFINDYGFIGEMINDGMNFVSSTFHFLPLVLVFTLNRLLTTFLLGVSFSEFMLGIRPAGNPLWARFGGVLRVLLGLITWPFIIFDVPSVISRRTLKEFMTFTRIQVPSKMTATLGIVLYVPIAITLAVFAPMVQGLETPRPIIVNDRIDQRVKVRPPQDEAPLIIDEVSESSAPLGVALTYNQEELTIVPNFNFYGSNKKLKLRTSLIFFQRDQQRVVELEIMKKFDLKSLLGIAMKGNVFLYEKYPQIYNFVYEAEQVNPVFRRELDAKAHAAFANEFIAFTKMAFSLGPDNVMDIVQNETLILKGLMDYRASFQELIEYKDFSEIGVIKIGNVLFMKISYSNKQKPFDLLIPLKKEEGHIFKVTFDSKENLAQVSSKFYKFNLEKTNWLTEARKLNPEGINSLGVFDLFSNPDFKKTLQTDTRAQSLYAYYFETSARLLKKNDPAEMSLWTNKVNGIIGLIETMPEAPAVDGIESTKTKLMQNFRDLKDALENNNQEYFGISQTTTI